jgi:ABC-type transport system involved in multi-copper enzyme maturation permease subunit
VSLAVALGGVALLAAWRLAAPTTVTSLLLAGELGLVAWAFHRHGRLHVIGPLCVYDLVRQARRGTTTVLRCLYALLLLGLLYVLVADHFPQYAGFKEFFADPPARSIHDWAHFAQRFVGAILTWQGIAVLLLTPAYLAGAVAEEKERKTIILLLTTRLRDREIVLGKLLGRLGHLGCILLTGLPILLLARLWGGVDGNVLLAGFVATALAMLSIGSVCMLCSVVANSVLVAVVSSYGLVLLLGIFCVAVPETSPVGFLSGYESRVQSAWTAWKEAVAGAQAAWAPGLPPPVRPPPPDADAILLQMLLACLTIHGSAFLICTALAVGLLREMCLAPGNAPVATPLPRAVVTSSWDPVEPLPAPRPRPVVTPVPAGTLVRTFDYDGLLYRRNVPVCEPALLWKEAYHGMLAPKGAVFFNEVRRHWLTYLVLIAVGMCLALILHTRQGPEWGEFIKGINYPVRFLTVLVAGVWCVALGFRVAGSITREREQQTLEPLLLLPVERREILAAKWQGSVLRSGQFGIALVVFWAFGLAVGVLHPWAVVLLVALCAAHIAFLASLGLWLSLNSRNTLWANMTMALVLLLLFGGAWMGLVDEALTSPGRDGPEWREVLLDVGLNPARAWWYAGFSWHDCAAAWANGDVLFWQRISTSLVGAAFYGAGAWVFWRLCCRRFEKKPPANRPRVAATNEPSAQEA